jgi:hypothetical protein
LSYYEYEDVMEEKKRRLWKKRGRRRRGEGNDREEKGFSRNIEQRFLI